MNKIHDIIIIGGGVSGLFAGYLLKKSGNTSFAILEKTKQAGRKLCVSGGGYGNLTNKFLSAQNYISNDNEFVGHALKSFSFKSAMALFKELKLELEEREFGQIFSLQLARDFRDKLANELPIITDCEVSAIRHDNMFRIDTSRGNFLAKKILIATGSPAYPQLEASAIGLSLAKSFKLGSYPFSPALTPFLLPESSKLRELSGISLDVGIKVLGKKLIRPLLFTHTGISGPAVLLLSCYHNGDNVEIDFLPSEDIIKLCHEAANGKLLLKNLLSRYLPNRLVDTLLPPELANKKVAELSKKHRVEIANSIHKYLISDYKLAPFAKAEAAKGGIATKDINPRTMESYKQENLYVSGEVLDVLGQLGGYNIHFALASAYVAVQAVLEKK